MRQGLPRRTAERSHPLIGGAARFPVVFPRQRLKPVRLGAYRQSRALWSLPDLPYGLNYELNKLATSSVTGFGGIG